MPEYSACFASKGKWEEAAKDAKACVEKKKDFLKGELHHDHTSSYQPTMMIVILTTQLRLGHDDDDANDSQVTIGWP